MTEGTHTPMVPPNSGTRARWPRILLLSGAMAAGVAIGAAGVAGAAMMSGHMGWHGPRLDRIQNFVRMSLDSVAATSEQEAKVHDIIASAFTDLAPKPGDRQAFRKQALDILRAPTIDKAALEKLRTDFVARQDARSKRFVDTVEQIADVLTPDQRAKLADRAEAWGDRMGGRRGQMDGNRGWRRGDGDNRGNPGGRGDNQEQGDDN